MVADEQALRAARISAQKLSQQDTYAIPLYSLFALTTLLVLAVNLILGLVYLVRKLASTR